MTGGRPALVAHIRDSDRCHAARGERGHLQAPCPGRRPSTAGTASQASGPSRPLSKSLPMRRLVVKGAGKRSGPGLPTRRPGRSGLTESGRAALLSRAKAWSPSSQAKTEAVSHLNATTCLHSSLRRHADCSRGSKQTLARRGSKPVAIIMRNNCVRWQQHTPNPSRTQTTHPNPVQSPPTTHQEPTPPHHLTRTHPEPTQNPHPYPGRTKRNAPTTHPHPI